MCFLMSQTDKRLLGYQFTTPFYRFYGLGLKHISPKERALLLTISFYLCELDVLQDRIQDGLEKVFAEETSKTNFWYDYFMLSTDVHSYVVAWTNLDKSLKRLATEIKDSTIQNTYNKRENWFKKMRIIRNHIEHLDERAIRSPEIRHTPNIIQVTGRNTASIYGEKFDIGKSGIKKVESISNEIQKWLLRRLPEDELVIYKKIRSKQD